MKEKEFTRNPELTRQAVNPKLNTGDIFMSEEGKEMETPQPDNRVRVARNAWTKINEGRAVSVDELRTQGLLIERGIPPIAGGAEDDTTPAEEEPSISRERIEADIEEVYNLPPDALTPEALDYLRKVAEKKVGVGITNNLRKILRQNGISKELIDKYQQDKPEILITMLVARNESYHSYQRDLDNGPIDFEQEEAASAVSAGGDGGGEKPPAPPTEPTPEEPEGEPAVAGDVEIPIELTEEAKNRLRIIANRKAAANQRADSLRSYLNDPDFRKNIDPRFSVGDTEDVIKDLMDIEKEEARVARNQKARQEAGDIYVPQSLEELAQLVMNRATPEYRVNRGDGERGEKCLLNEDGTVNTVHFLDWARNNYFLTHLANPTAEVNFFSDIATNVKTEGIGSTISFYEITYTESYFLQAKRDAQGNVIRDANGEVTPVENEDYKALREQMLYEVFLLQLQRNPAVTFVLQNRSEREKMLNAVAAANVFNPITRGNFLETILSQPSMKSKSIRDLDPSIVGKELKAKIEGNFAMGDATREALAAYININDYESLVKILGADSPLFKYLYEKYDAWTGKRDKDGEMLKTAKDVKDADKRKKQWFKEDGKTLQLYAVVELGRNKGKYIMRKNADNKDEYVPVEEHMPPQDGLPHPEFMRYLNIFLTPTPDTRQQDEIRERIRLSIMESNGISYREAQIAELMAYSMAQINGVAARNDSDSVAFDWWTRVTNFLDKRKREKSPTRNAPYGSEFNMEGLKRIGLNFFEAARDIRGRSIRKIIQGGESGDIRIQDDPLKNTD